ncbi:hypothetical protein F5Y00DRAFT_223566 [Daldinia vernicosa]|uniref:uncharacterized protein n=1 Tax=Daldinia vernicosa TaxID=114800 RepID=UPI002007A81D|nr:uncharacterized protein F5Y00DRAFT_223566 [Daldinia vernicosa]KAI0853778.1 hypothetical protein F5Y00DRAFT_223566 [Daldinia vernicosa]
METTTPHPRSSLRRTACDRCRHSKLRCLRDENQEKCTRCLRLDLRCSVAPAKPPGRPRKVASSSQTTISDSAAAEASIPPVQLLVCESHDTPEAQGSIPPSQSPDNLLLPPGLDDLPQVNGSFAETPSLPHSHVNDFDLNPIMLPLSEYRTPEWDEPTRFNSGCSADRDPLEVHSLLTAKLDRHECLKELSQLNVDLHAHWRALQELDESGRVNFVTFCDHPPPPAGDGVSLAEKLLIMAQRFQQAITNLVWVVKHEPKPLHHHHHGHVVADDGAAIDSSSSSSSYAEEPLLGHLGQEDNCQTTVGDTPAEKDVILTTPFVCVLVSCYVQTINLWEVMFFHAHRRAIGIDRYPLTLSDPSKGVQLGAFYMFSGRLASMFYCQAVLYFLDNIDRGLGILPEQRQQQGGASGLISHARHFDMLQKELGGQVSDGANERVRGLKDMVEKARLGLVQESGN